MADISTPNLDYNDMLEAWDINDALMGGTLEMRRQGENYLPKWPNEDEDAYKKRLSVATLLPVYEESIKQNIGRIFAEPTVLSEETPAKIREYAENIDMEESRLDVWAQQFFSLAFQYGVAHALVDYPRTDMKEIRTKADENATGGRPYVTMLNPRQVIGWKSKVEKGKVVLTDLRIKEVIIIDGDDFGQKKVEQIRHIMPRRVEIYRRSEGTNGESVWTLHESWNNRTAINSMFTSLSGELNELAIYEAGYQLSLFDSMLPDFVADVHPLVGISPDALYAAAMARPFQGRLLSEWASDLEADRLRRITNTVRQGFLQGDTNEQIARKIRGHVSKGFQDGALQMSRANAASIAKTAVGHLAATARESFASANSRQYQYQTGP